MVNCLMVTTFKTIKLKSGLLMKPEGNNKTTNFKKRSRYPKGAKAFILFWVVFSTGLFFGEWLLDVILNSKRDTISGEARDAVLVGLIVAFLLVVQQKSLKKIHLYRFFIKEK